MNNSILSAMYLRKSRADDPGEDVMDTLHRHESILRAVAKRGKYLVHEDCIYREVVSGENIFSRPQMIRLLEDVTKGKYQSVLVVDIDRLGRGDMRDQGLILETFKAADTLIVTPEKVYDLNNEMDEELTEFKGFMARREYKMITKRLKRGREQTVRAGGFVADPPYGWKRAKINNLPSLEPHETEGPIMQMIVEMYGNQEPISAIQERLAAMGVYNRKGQPFCRSSIRHIATNPVNAGLIRWNRYKNIRKGQNGSPTGYEIENPPEDVILVKGVHQPQVSVEAYQKCVNVCKSRAAPSVKKGLHGVVRNPLSGIVICSNCGSRMQMQHSSTKDTRTLLCTHPGCMPGVDIVRAEAAMLDILRDKLEEIRTGQGKKQQDKALAALQKSVHAAEKNIQILKKQQDKLYTLLEQEVYSLEVFKERNQVISQKLTDAQEQLKIMQDQVDDLSSRKEERLAQNIEDVLANYEYSSIKEKNRLLKTVVEKAIYFRKTRTSPFALDVTFINM